MENNFLLSSKLKLLIVFINISTIGWTGIGMLTFGISALLLDLSYDYLKNYLNNKKVLKVQNK